MHARFFLGVLTLLAPAVVFSQSPEELVKSFETLVPRLLEAGRNSPEVNYPPDSGQWWRRRWFTANPAIDVRRTDSLVSPYVGELSFSCKVETARASSEEAVKAMPLAAGPLSSQCKANYAYQSGKWEFKTLACTGLPGQPYRPVAPGPRGDGPCFGFVPKD